MHMYGAAPRLERGPPSSKTARPWLVPAVVTLLTLAAVFVHGGRSARVLVFVYNLEMRGERRRNTNW